MQRYQNFPAPLGIRLAPETRAWLDVKARAERTTASALARRYIEEQAKHELLKKGEEQGAAAD
jgi:hypothetical protein